MADLLVSVPMTRMSTTATAVPCTVPPQPRLASCRRTTPSFSLLSLPSLSPFCPGAADAMDPSGKPRSGLPRRHQRPFPRRPSLDPAPQPLPRTDRSLQAPALTDVLHRGLNTQKTQGSFCKNETFPQISHLKRDCGLNKQNYSDFFAKLMATYDQKQ